MTIENRMTRLRRLAPTSAQEWDHPGEHLDLFYSASPAYDYRGAGFACQDENRNIYVTGLKVETEDSVSYLRQYLFKMDYDSEDDTYALTEAAGWPVLLTEEVWESPYLISRGPAALGCAYSRAGYVAAWTNEKPYLGDVISWYRLRNIDGTKDTETQCWDESGNEYHGTFRAEDFPEWVTDDSLACLQFVGDATLEGNNTTIGWVDTTPSGWYDAADDVSLIAASTFEAWFKTDTDYETRNENGQIFMFSNSSNATPAIRLSVTINGNAVAFTWSDDAWSGENPGTDQDHNIHIEGGGPVNDGEWHHVMGVRHSASSFKLYLDGC